MVTAAVACCIQSLAHLESPSPCFCKWALSVSVLQPICVNASSNISWQFLIAFSAIHSVLQKLGTELCIETIKEHACTGFIL